ncbi:MutT domain-containing protein [Salinisphaera sp. S4-8]|uniref:NUDIX hydrolase n=1 Tax=Salinisphaera sp. S4-8 TaxID=633357 RepID=UPI003341D207
MKPLRCACLVAEQDGKLLLVRVRQNAHWYLPGGKIEDDESPEAALHRELHEELGITLTLGSLRYLYSVTGPAYGQAGEVELICFAAAFRDAPRSCSEISAVDWLPVSNFDEFAPAVRILCESFLGAAGRSVE